MITSIPDYCNVKSCLNKYRRLGVTEDPTCASVIMVPEDLRFFEDGKLLLQLEKRIIIFFHEEHIQ